MTPTMTPTEGEFMKKVLLATLAAGFVTHMASAQIISDPGSGSSSEDAITFPYFDLHGNNRAIGFGTVLLVAEGYTVDNWKALNAWDMCGLWLKPIPGSDADDEPGPTPIPGPTDPMPGECLAELDVMVTTDYTLEVCPDGRAYTLRNGIGIYLDDRHTGSSYAWGEVVFCGDDLKAATYDRKTATQTDRPLDRTQVIRTFN